MHVSDPHPPDPTAPDVRRVQAWSDYWSSGALHSCAGSFQGNYEGALRRFWERVFRSAPAAPRLLDLCSGNAPLAKLWLEAAWPAHGGSLDAVDAAAIAPPWLASLPVQARAAIRVHAHVDVARLPFEAASFDLCTSQYGVEYVGPVALREACRVLRAGGRFAAVVHHAQSLPVRIGREELLQHDWLRGADGLLACAADMLEPMARSADPAGRAALQRDAEARRRRERYDAALHQLQARASAARWPDLLLEVHATLAGILRVARESGAAAGHQELAALGDRLARDQLRQRELVDCACDAAGLQALLAPFGAGPCEIGEVAFDNGELAGWTVLAQRD
jgi:SAM-dependent methyltransferase